VSAGSAEVPLHQVEKILLLATCTFEKLGVPAEKLIDVGRCWSWL
jgi:hypothetical protein